MMPYDQDLFIRQLAARGILGVTEGEVRRALIDRAIQGLISTEYVQKHMATLAALRVRAKRSSRT